MITYTEQKEFSEEELQQLFLSVQWESGKYPGQLKLAMQNSTEVISAWDGNRLVGLIRGLSDGVTVGFIHYLLVNPEYQGFHIGGILLSKILEKYETLFYVKVMPSDPGNIAFYERYGFRLDTNNSAMEIKRI